MVRTLSVRRWVVAVTMLHSRWRAGRILHTTVPHARATCLQFSSQFDEAAVADFAKRAAAALAPDLVTPAERAARALREQREAARFDRGLADLLAPFVHGLAGKLVASASHHRRRAAGAAHGHSTAWVSPTAAPRSASPKTRAGHDANSRSPGRAASPSAQAAAATRSASPFAARSPQQPPVAAATSPLGSAAVSGGATPHLAEGDDDDDDNGSEAATDIVAAPAPPPRRFDGESPSTQGPPSPTWRSPSTTRGRTTVATNVGGSASQRASSARLASGSRATPDALLFAAMAASRGRATAEPTRRQLQRQRSPQPAVRSPSQPPAPSASRYGSSSGGVADAAAAAASAASAAARVPSPSPSRHHAGAHHSDRGGSSPPTRAAATSTTLSGSMAGLEHQRGRGGVQVDAAASPSPLRAHSRSASAAHRAGAMQSSTANRGSGVGAFRCIRNSCGRRPRCDFAGNRIESVECPAIGGGAILAADQHCNVKHEVSPTDMGTKIPRCKRLAHGDRCSSLF